MSFDRPAKHNIPVSPWIARFAPLISPGGPVLDVAAGHGRHARYFAARGHPVLAADIDASALRELEGVEVLEADLEGAESWPLGDRRFAGIVVTNYLHRPLFARLASALASDGVLIWETFGAGNERFGRPRNPDFLLAPGEMLEAFAGDLQIVAYEHGIERHPRTAVRQRICACRRTAPQPLSPEDGAPD